METPSLARARKFVAVVEDEAIVRDIAAIELEDRGFGVLEFETADQALPYLERHGGDIAVLITDVQMPGVINGLDLALTVKRLWPRVPILVTSGGPLVNPALLPPTIRFMPKPWRPAEMAERVEQMALVA